MTSSMRACPGVAGRSLQMGLSMMDDRNSPSMGDGVDGVNGIF